MLCAQRDRFKDIRAAPDAAVDSDLDAALRYGRTRAQGVEGGGCVVELAAAVVGDDDAVDGVRDGELDVCWVQDCRPWMGVRERVFEKCKGEVEGIFCGPVGIVRLDRCAYLLSAISAFRCFA